MTDLSKYGLGALALLFGLYLYNQNAQSDHLIEGAQLFTHSHDDVNKVIISEKDQSLELQRSDSTWVIVGIDSLIIKDNQIDNLFNRVISIETDMLISSKPEKWEKFGVDDSLGKHLKVYNLDGTELLHFILGNTGNDYQHNYIRLSGSNDVFRTNDNIFHILNTAPSYWGKTPTKEPIEF